MYMSNNNAILIMYALHVHVAFTISPSSQVVGVGQQAVFRCQNLDALVITWTVNETHVTSLIPHPDPGITIDMTIDENNEVVHILSIAAQSIFNETMIICIANLMNETAPVKLFIQGEPAMYL